MSFRRGNSVPGAIVSGAQNPARMGALAGVAIVAGAIALLALPAAAQTAAQAKRFFGEFERPYGFGYGEETQPVDAGTRDANGNRVVLDGRIMTGSDQSAISSSTAGASAWSQSSGGAGFGGGVLGGTAIGNQVNVITQGNYNTVVVTTTQTNSGNQTILNGRLNLQ